MAHLSGYHHKKSLTVNHSGAFFTGEVLVKEPVEIIERTYCLTEDEAKQWEELKNGTT